jgi:hypothetical protein
VNLCILYQWKNESEKGAGLLREQYALVRRKLMIASTSYNVPGLIVSLIKVFKLISSLAQPESVRLISMFGGGNE